MKVLRAQAVVFLLSASLVCIAVGCEKTHPAPSSPHVVLISVDTLRADHLGCYGYFRPTSPRLDRFVEECVKFERAETPINQTLPAHASMLSSVLPREHGAVGNRFKINTGTPLLAPVLSANGYETMAVLAAAPLDSEFGLARGFDVYEDTSDKGLSLGTNRPRTGDEVVEVVRAVTKGRDNIRPLFLFVHFWDTHNPYFSTKKSRKYFEHTEELDKIVEERNAKEFSWNRINKYDSAVRALDGWLFDLLEYLEDEGILDHALIIITSDHGEGLGQHDYWGHGEYLYEQETWVPLIVRMPGGERGGRSVGTRVSTIDIAPTVYEFLGIDMPRGVVGTSLIHAINGDAKPPEKDVIIERRWWAPNYKSQPVPGELSDSFAVVRDNWKYIWHSKDSDELYDLAADPFEMNNLIKDEPEKAMALLKIIKEHRDKVGPMPTEPPQISEKAKKNLKALGYID